MNVGDVVGRADMNPGEAALPWGDAVFATRMLREHLNDQHDLASRRVSIIEAHVEWLQSVSGGRRVLDLACGPGLYLERFARNGWEGVGVDISPAAIQFAKERARDESLDCTYVEGDFRDFHVEGEFDLVLCLFGQISTLSISDVEAVLSGISRHLRSGGRAVIEVSTKAGVMAKGTPPTSWFAADGGLFAEGRHAVLYESRWLEEDAASVERWWIIEEAPPRVTMLGSTTWWHEQLGELLASVGLTVEARFADLTGADPCTSNDFETLLLRSADAV